MAFRASLSVMSKASRLPLTSKQARKDFYKGPGAMPGLGPRAQGRHSRSSRTYVLDPARMRYFVTPEGWLREDGGVKAIYTSSLKPYVFKGERPLRPNDWPAAASKPLEDLSSRNEGIYGPKGFDGEYYLQLAHHLKGSE